LSIQKVLIFLVALCVTTKTEKVRLSEKSW